MLFSKKQYPERDEELERLSNMVRQGQPIGFSNALAVINYQTKLKNYRQSQSFFNRLKKMLYK